jgi:uncharacterized protein (DUF2384 family)
MPVEIAEKVRAVSQKWGSPRTLAVLLDVRPAEVTRRIEGGAVDDLTASRVDALEAVSSQLLQMYTAEVAATWLRGLNPHIHDRRPIDLIRRGHSAEVLDAIAQARAGSYA